MSVRKRSWKSPTGEIKSAWQIDYVDAGGIRRRETVATKKEADARHAQVQVGVANGTHTANAASVTVAAACQQWLDNNGGENPWERATFVAYSQHVANHIVPFLGAVKLSQLSVPAIAGWEQQLRMDGRSFAMVRKVRVSLGSVLAHAMVNGLVHQNVVAARGKAKASTRHEARAEVGVDIPSTADIRALIPQLSGILRPLILTAAFTGLRWSELRGLTWAAIDLQAATLTVSQRMDRYGVIGSPKSSAGKRTVPLLPLVVNALREHRLASAPGQELVFVNGQGNALHRNTVIEAYQAAQVAAGIVDATGAARYPGLHALRHFFASWCINRKADGGRELPLKVVQGLLGHASIQMTADVYGHLFPRQDDHAELAAAERAFLVG